MAKWKNALLISTIVAPIAFGASPLGDALAQARPGSDGVTPYTAVDVHKMLKTTSGDPATDPQNIFWGDGTTQTAENFFGANGWSAATNALDKYEFTAYRLDLGNKVITGYEPAKKDGQDNTDAGMPIFSTTNTLTIGGNSYSWAELLTATKVPTTGVNQDNRVNGKAKETVSEYTISLTLPSGVTPADFQAAMKAAEDSYIATYNGKPENANKQLNASDYYMEDTTDASGVAAFEGSKALHNGQWVIFETSKPGYVASGEEAVPMVLNLPMQKAAAAYSDTGWFGTATADHLNLYAKNYTQKGDLTVEKQDSKTGDGVEGAWIGLFTDKVTQDIADSISAEVKDLDPSSATITSQIEAAVETGIENAVKGSVDLSDYLVAVDKTKENGKVKFNNLEPNKTYGVLELVEPAGYTVNSTLKSITLSPADAVKDSSDATDEDASDGAVYFQGGEYDFGNFTPKVDKSIKVTGQTGWTGQGVEGKEDNQIDDDDDHQGVDRGEDFKWLIQSDLPADGTIFTTYKLTDTLPYQTNWYSALVNVAGVDLVNVQHINPQGKGGLTGNGITYDNQKDGNAKKITAISAEGVVTEADAGVTLKSGVDMAEVQGAYTNLVNKLGQATVDSLIGTTVTTDDQLAD
ncbi:hypothetical protein FM131_04995 [Weissella confusa]|uniref:SpaA isopeptide-forming pilin-related protein n=1 Tax=Weissella confusa TaxID=1583 RepID=UPI000989A28E|nr:SpaA isopeptide-forming pilin-related protein [Weissella confusa]SJX68805.1 hypothetical protein FM131_04995 [Weissella confusa]